MSARSAPTTLYRVAHSLLQNYSLRYPLPALLRTRLIDLWAGMAMLNTYCVRCGEHIAWWPSGRERRWDYSLELAFDMPKLGVKVLHHAPTAHELDEFQKNPGQSLPLQGLSIFNLKGHLAGVPMQYALNKTGYSPGTGFPSRVYHGWLRREGTAQNKYVLDAEKRDLAAKPTCEWRKIFFRMSCSKKRRSRSVPISAWAFTCGAVTKCTTRTPTQAPSRHGRRP